MYNASAPSLLGATVRKAGDGTEKDPMKVKFVVNEVHSEEPLTPKKRRTTFKTTATENMINSVSNKVCRLVVISG